MHPVHGYGELADDNDSDDSDIQEIAIIPARSATLESSHHVKRRKSSPQMDPLPSYTPTPLHILEQRARNNTSTSYPNNIEYTPTAISSSTKSPDSFSSNSYPSKRNYYEYTPLLEPSPCVVGSTTIRQPEQVRGRGRPRKNAILAAPNRNSASAFRAASSSALSEAVARRRNSQTEKEKANIPTTVQLNQTSAAKATSAYQEVSSTEAPSVEEPVMWSPQLPSQIQPVKEDEKDKIEDEIEKYKSPRMPKQRVAHKPTVPLNKQKRPRLPLGVAKKVPASLRIKYLDVIISEYLNTGHEEQESYDLALSEEKDLANRAANKSIYINLIASLKKKIREKAGISTLPQDQDPKFVNGNKVVSHSEIITGKVTGTFSIERKRKSSDPADLNECELYDRLLRYLLPIEELEKYGYPCRDPDEPNLRKVPLCKDGHKQQLRCDFAESYICDRCTKVYRVNPNTGMPLATTSKCIYHPGHMWNERINRALEKRYSCCKGDPSAGGCSSNPYHVHKGELELANYEGFVETQPKLEREPNKHGIYALDCEMCYTTIGLELTRVTVINHKSEVVYEKLVKPANSILDYNTKFSGIKKGDLDNIETTIVDVQKDLLDLFSSKSLIIGHSLDSDMKALKIFHSRYIDTAQLFPHKRGLPFKRALRTLMQENLHVIIQEDSGHDSKEDASAALRLVMWKAKTDVPTKST